MNRINYPRPLYKIQDWPDHIFTIDLFGISSDLLNDNKFGRCLKPIRDFGVSPELMIWDTSKAHAMIPSS
jgi:hypothetical protein